jgi:hypothetical protein
MPCLPLRCCGRLAKWSFPEMHRISFIAIAALLAAGTAAAQTTPRHVAPKDLGKYWLVASEAMEAMVPNSGVNLHTPSCAVVRYVINSDGSTSDVVLEKLVPMGDLSIVAVSAVKSLRYAPTTANQALTPVLTRVTLPLNLPPVRGTPEEQARIEAQRTQVLAACDAPAVPKPAGKSDAAAAKNS